MALCLAACSSATGGSNLNGGQGNGPGAGGTGSGGTGSGTGGAGGPGGAGSGSGGFGAFGPGPGPSSNCAAETEFVYVLNAANVLYRFDPTVASPAAFTKIGPLGCSAGQGPNSMSVGRDGFAYVLYGADNGLGGYKCAGVYRVDITDASCKGQTSFQCGSAGFKKFGMGFTTDAPGGDADSLYIGNSLANPMLGKVDLTSGQVTAVGTLPGGAEFTGNSNAELWGFFPDQNAVIQVDKASGGTLASYPLSGLPQATLGYAYAFAFWGGAFYVFYYAEGQDASSNVYKLDPSNGSFGKYISNVGFRIVGAGVSTCAPLVAPK